MKCAANQTAATLDTIIYDDNEIHRIPYIWFHFKEPQVVELSEALHYGISHNNVVVLGR